MTAELRNSVQHKRPSLTKRKVILNAFDMSTVSHLAPGQWKNPEDKGTSKFDLDYWVDLAKLLERGGINALFLADTFGVMTPTKEAQTTVSEEQCNFRQLTRA
ncbi:hypothetical protein V1506DRAFT_548928 [Lipomyces tetrasporus]